MSRKRRTLKVKLRWAFALAAAAGAVVIGVNRKVLLDTDSLIYKSVESVPYRRVALVLGTSPRLANGNPNPFFERRMDAAARLYVAGKVDRILVSGDNGSVNYDEPTAMRSALARRGVPESAIRLDYAGFRTLDSIVRANRVFGLSQVTIVTDDFHLPRALYIAQHEGLHAIGFQTKPLPVSVSPRTFVREIGSRTMMFVDLYLLHREPKFLGPRESI